MAHRDIEEWFWQVGNEMQRLTEELASGRPKVASARFWEPRIDLCEDERRFILKAEIAGVKGEDIQLLYIPERHSLLLRGNRPEEDPTDGNRTGIYQLEIYYGEFQREVPLPDIPIVADGIRAQYRNGFLLVMIPKRERAALTKVVKVKAY